MENASKALIIAGSILITIIVISLGIMIFRTMANSVNNEANLDKQQIATFNSKISPYIGEHVSGSQVKALLQLARTINTKAKNEDDTVRKIKINGEDENFDSSRYQIGEFYKVTGSYENGLLTNITIE